jgi:hypothetical protein
LPSLLFPSHVRFVRVDWSAIKANLLRWELPAEKIMAQAKSHGGRLHGALSYLRQDVGLNNVHRLVRSSLHYRRGRKQVAVGETDTCAELSSAPKEPRKPASFHYSFTTVSRDFIALQGALVC